METMSDRTIDKLAANHKGPLESVRMTEHCEMCGNQTNVCSLEPAFDPRSHAKTLCRDCRIGSAELLAEYRTELLEALRAWVEAEQDAHFEEQAHDEKGCRYCESIAAIRKAEGK
jgi:hypothetical protein